MKRTGVWGTILLAATLSGCGDGFERPENTVDLNAPAATMLERQDDHGRVRPEPGSALRGNAQRCRDEPVPLDAMAAVGSPSAVLPLSAGDLVHVGMPGDEPPAGNYKVDSDGTISFTHVGKLPVSGLAVEQVEADLARKLVASGLYRAGHAHPTIRLLDRDQVRVMVAGAVFSPGQVTINERPQVPDATRQTAAGDHAIGRTLSAALSHAAGVRPDADIAHIVVEHAGRRQLVDFFGFLDGSPVYDMPLVDGDRVSVSSRHCFQAKLARPTPITPPGVRVYMSNLTQPALNNASSGIGRDQSNLPYGTRLLQALFSANCVGGAKVTNAHRGAVLVSTNPETGESEVIERDIEALIRRPDRDLYNPVILPNDAIACYDSTVTNAREVLRSLGDLATSVAVVRLLAP
jgi:protein involved in polysaccharide export with SLBB domain